MPAPLVLASLLAVSPLAEVLPSAEPDSVEPAQCALLVGVAKYPNLGEALQLRGPENDVLLVERTLIDVLDFAPENITTLTTRAERDEDRPTRARILEEIARVAESARGGGVSEFVLYLCGHGTQLPDPSGDELDGRDEAFLPCDVAAWDEASGSAPGALLDDDLEAAIAAVAEHAGRVVLIVDACHSGTLMRGSNDDGVVWRELSPSRDLSIPDTAWPEAPTTDRRDDSGYDLDGVVALYAAGSEERTPEVLLKNLLATSPDRMTFGVFTHSLVKELHDSRGEETFAQLLDRVRARYDRNLTATSRPTGEGSLSAPVRISGNPPTFQVLLVRGAPIIENYGLIHDAVEGAEFDIFHPGRSGDPDARVGSFRVKDVGLASSTGEFIELHDWPDGVMGAPAELVRAPVQPRRLRVAFEDGDGSCDTGSALRRAVESYPSRFELVDSIASCEWVVRGASGDWPPVAYRPDRGVAEGFLIDGQSLAGVLSKVFRVSNLMNLTSHPAFGSLPEGVEVRAVPEEPGPGGVALPGTRVRFEARNLSDRTWFLTLHTIDSAYAMTHIRLKSGGELVPGTDWTFIDDRRYVFTDDTLGAGYVHVLALKWKRDLPNLTQDPLQRMRSGETKEGVGAVLNAVAFGGKTRGVDQDDVEETDASAGFVEFVTDWPHVEPRTSARRAVDLERPVSTGERCVVRLRPIPKHRTRYMTVEDERGSATFLDLDGDFDAELCIRRDADRVATFYDLDGASNDDEGPFELVLVDFDRDGRADVVHEYVDGEWTVDTSRRPPMVQIDRFPQARKFGGGRSYKDWRNRALSTVGTYFRTLDRPAVSGR